MRRTLSAVALLIVSVSGVAQSVRPYPEYPATHTYPPEAEYNFARLAYSENISMGGWNGWARAGWRSMWAVDWPEAEQHLIEGIRRLTNVESSDAGRIVSLKDDVVFDFPMLYAVEVGYLSLDDDEVARLREYLLRGGFFMVDDFHGSHEWASFLAQIKRVFPDRPIVEIAESDEIMHVLYDVDERVQIPGIYPLRMGQTWEQDGYTPHWRGIYDDDGRLMVVINLNMDLGDAWEHADWPSYPEPMTALAYRFGVNYIVYAMTH